MADSNQRKMILDDKHPKAKTHGEDFNKLAAVRAH